MTLAWTLQILLDLLFVAAILWLARRTASLSHLSRPLRETLENFQKMLQEANLWGERISLHLHNEQVKSEKTLEELNAAHKSLTEEERKLLVSLPESEKSQKVLLLHNQGLSIEEISKGLSLPRGEVELVLSLVTFLQNRGRSDSLKET